METDPCLPGSPLAPPLQTSPRPIGMTGTRRIVHLARDPCLSRELNISSLDTSFSNLRTLRLFLTFSTSVLWLGWRGFFAAATLLSVFSLQDVHIHSVISLYLLKQTHNITHQLNGSCDQ